jgi:hypothetical protein
VRSQSVGDVGKIGGGGGEQSREEQSRAAQWRCVSAGDEHTQVEPVHTVCIAAAADMLLKAEPQLDNGRKLQCCLDAQQIIGMCILIAATAECTSLQAHVCCSRLRVTAVCTAWHALADGSTLCLSLHKLDNASTP